MKRSIIVCIMLIAGCTETPSGLSRNSEDAWDTRSTTRPTVSSSSAAPDTAEWRNKHYRKPGTLREKDLADGSLMEFYECACGLTQVTLYDSQGEYKGGGSALPSADLFKGSRKLPEPKPVR